METSVQHFSQAVPANCACGGPLSVGKGYRHATCKSCKSYWFPTSIEESEDRISPQQRVTPFSCPRCEVDLEVGKLDGTEVCYCPTCRGFITDSESLGAVIQCRRSSYAGPEDKPVLANFSELDVRGMCPACFGKMEAHHYCGPGNIVLDTCMKCKLAWLDHGEISKIIRAPGRR